MPGIGIAPPYRRRAAPEGEALPPQGRRRAVVEVTPDPAVEASVAIRLGCICFLLLD